MDKKKNDDYRRINGYFRSSIKCKICGHTILPTNERVICTHCGYWNYRNNKVEFKYRTKETLIKEKRKEKWKQV